MVESSVEAIEADSIVEGRNGPMSHLSFVRSIEEANAQFAISDSEAKAAVLGIKELREAIEHSDGDTSCHKYFFTGNVPTKDRPVWELQVMQVCAGAEHGDNRVFIDVDANTGEITSITDYDVSINDVYYSVDEWLKAKNNNVLPNR